MREKVVVLDCGGPNGQLAARKIRERNVYCEVYPYTAALDKIKEGGTKAVIFTGGAGNCNTKAVQERARELAGAGVPILYIVDDASEFAQQGQDVACMDASQLRDEKALGGLHQFLFDDCGLKGDWNMSSYSKESIQAIKEKVGDKKVLCALSGGVDSSVSAVMISKAIGKQLTCIFVDHGLLRKNEVEEVEGVFSKQYDLNFVRIDARERFYNKLKGVEDPEKKRKIIGEEFIRVFEEEAKRIGKVDFLAQGTIYPDVLESGIGGSAVIKSHHNVGGLPDVVDFEDIIEPLRLLFKDEVRRMGIELGIPEKLVMRQPFPGPGLAVRVVGEVTPEKVRIIQNADAIFREEVAKAGLDREYNQYFAALTNMRSVGVRGEERTYEYAVVLRAVLTTDFMTAEAAEVPWELLKKVTGRIVGEVEGVNRVMVDCTGKPPGTIELE